MAYGRKYRKKNRRGKRTMRRSKRKGFRRRDYTPSVKLEAFYTVGTSSVNSSNIIFTTGGSTFTNACPYVASFDLNGTWGKYSNNYSIYKVTGASCEWGFTRDPLTLEGLFNTMPYIAGVHFPAEAPNFTTTPAVIRQVDNSFNISPKITGMARNYIRYPTNYINNKLNAVGIGTWNSVGDASSQMGVICFGPINGAYAINNTVSGGNPAFSQTSFAFVKVSVYVRFGSKRI